MKLKIDHKKLLFIRWQIVFLFTLTFYLLSIYYFFFSTKLLFWLLFSVIFFIIIHYFLIDLKKIDLSNLILFIVFILILNLLILKIDNIFYVIWIIFFHIAILFLVIDIHEEIYNRINISTRKIFNMWSRLFSMILSLVFALTFFWTYKTFDLTCDKFYSLLENTSNIAKHYLNIHFPKIKKDIKVKDFFWKILNWKNENQFNDIKLSYLVDPLFWKVMIANQIVENKKILDKKFCQIIIFNIKNKYTKPWFQFSVMFLMFMLFYPIIRFVIFLLSFVNYILFHFAIFLRIYKYKKIVDDVEIIE